MRYLKSLIAGSVALTMVGGALFAGEDGSRQESASAAVVERPVLAAAPEEDPAQTPADAATSTTSTAEAAAIDDDPSGPGDGVVFDPVHEVIAGGDDSAVPTDGPAEPIGGLHDFIPEGLDLTSFPGAPAPGPTVSPGVSGPSVLTAGPGCHNQCITSGVAYPRGFGAELVVTTNVPAQIFMAVVADTNDDGLWDFDQVNNSFGMVSDFSWALDDLEPGQRYHVMAAGTDKHDNTSYVWGEFTTLSERNITLTYGDLEIWGGPDNISLTRLWHEVNDHDVTEPGINILNGVGRSLDLKVWVGRGWHGDLCEGWLPHEGASSNGHSNNACLTWNSGMISNVDLDVLPGGKTRWTSATFETSVHSPTGAGDALPPGYGDPYYFGFDVPVTVHVEYR